VSLRYVFFGIWVRANFIESTSHSFNEAHSHTIYMFALSLSLSLSTTQDPLVVFSSNLFAIMGLRSMYTILSKAATDLKYLEPAVALVLGFIGAKMIGEYFGYEFPTTIALAVVASVLTTGVAASVWEKQSRLVVDAGDKDGD
jgi:predicted tellurium resistance membrane protein TerC